MPSQGGLGLASPHFSTSLPRVVWSNGPDEQVRLWRCGGSATPAVAYPGTEDTRPLIPMQAAAALQGQVSGNRLGRFLPISPLREPLIGRLHRHILSLLDPYLAQHPPAPRKQRPHAGCKVPIWPATREATAGDVGGWGRAIVPPGLFHVREQVRIVRSVCRRWR